jgi:hypothetical protein
MIASRWVRGSRTTFAMPRCGKRACCQADAGQHPQSRTLQLCVGQRCVHPMSFAGAPIGKPDRRQALRLAHRFPRWIESAADLAYPNGCSSHCRTLGGVPCSDVGANASTIPTRVCTRNAPGSAMKSWVELAPDIANAGAKTTASALHCRIIVHCLSDR